MMATAFAAHGWVEKAREHLTNAVRGPAWEAALEHRLFLDAMLLSFEGEGTQAQYAAARLARLPLPVADAEMARQVMAMRLALSALARAFCREAERGDTEVMMAVGEASPLVSWPMRYGAAINHLDAGRPGEAEKLLKEAPVWPEESRFRSLHEELRVEAARQLALVGPSMTGDDGPLA